MNKYILLCFVLLSSSFLFSQNFKNDSVKIFIDTSLTLIKSHSINTKNIDAIQKKLYSESKNFTSINDILPLYRDVFKQLNDHHGSLNYNGKTYGWTKPHTTNNLYLKEKIKTETIVSGNIIDDQFGYIRIPGNNDFSFKKVDSIANNITSNINAVNSNKIEGWIIDLRLNTGGNMYPILLGLKELIGNNIIFGGFKNAQNQPTGKWEIRNGEMIIDSIKLERTTNLDKPIKNNIPIVILTSCYTASAGEMTAISFIGRENAFIVGEATANYTTAVQGFKINNNAGINLSTDYVIDRNQKIYKNNIIPNFEISGGDNLENLKKDSKIIKALELLREY